MLMMIVMNIKITDMKFIVPIKRSKYRFEIHFTHYTQLARLKVEILMQCKNK